MIDKTHQANTLVNLNTLSLSLLPNPGIKSRCRASRRALIVALSVGRSLVMSCGRSCDVLHGISSFSRYKIPPSMPPLNNRPQVGRPTNRFSVRLSGSLLTSHPTPHSQKRGAQRCHFLSICDSISRHILNSTA